MFWYCCLSCHVIVVHVLLLHSGVEKKYLLGTIKSKVCEPTSKVSPEILVFQTVNGMIGGVGIWKWAHWKQLEKRNLKKMSIHVSPDRLYPEPQPGSERSGVFCGRHPCPAAASFPSLPFFSLPPSSLLSSPEGFRALKHCIRAPPTGQRNFTATDRYKPETVYGHNSLQPCFWPKGSNECTKLNIIQMCCISQGCLLPHRLIMRATLWEKKKTRNMKLSYYQLKNDTKYTVYQYCRATGRLFVWPNKYVCILNEKKK